MLDFISVIFHSLIQPPYLSLSLSLCIFHVTMILNVLLLGKLYASYRMEQQTNALNIISQL